MFTISFDHNQSSFEDSILVDGKVIPSIIDSMDDKQQEAALNKTVELFKKAKLKYKEVNSKIIAESIAESINNDNETVLVSVLAGAKAYSSSQEVRIVALKFVLDNIKSPSQGVEEFMNLRYLNKMYKDNPKILNVSTLMTVGLIYGVLADIVDIAFEPKKRPRSVKSFYKAILK